MPIVRPRLTDYYGVLISQAEADFAIPFLDEDIPLYLDPFLLWRSPSQQDNALHTALINSFNHFGYLEKQGKHSQAIDTLTAEGGPARPRPSARHVSENKCGGVRSYCLIPDPTHEGATDEGGDFDSLGSICKTKTASK